jgi:hypothetical protein
MTLEEITLLKALLIKAASLVDPERLQEGEVDAFTIARFELGILPIT